MGLPVEVCIKLMEFNLFFQDKDKSIFILMVLKMLRMKEEYMMGLDNE